ncbi:MAG: hypothetical protein HMLIMOIP_002005 [Candidatus Nitrosomirales archaeon]|jgi:hypothetical protein
MEHEKNRTSHCRPKQRKIALKGTIVFLLAAQLIVATIFALTISSQTVEAAKKGSPHSTSSDLLLPDLRPVKNTLMDYDLVKDPKTGQILLRFAGGMGNYGEGTLEIVGKRASISSDKNSMPAYQRVYKEDGTFDEIQVGVLSYHPEHHHYHFVNAIKYSLTDPTTGNEISAKKEAFCLADVAVIDDTITTYSQTPVYNQCYPNPNAKFVRMGVSPGWEDVYGKDLIGQAFDVTALMEKPQQIYILEEITNPDGSLIDSNDGKPQKTSIEVIIGQGVEVGVGKSRPGV